MPETSGAPAPAREMNPADFKNMYFYKLLIPAFTWGSILGTFLGPFLFPAPWFLFVAGFMVVFVLVSLSQVWSCWHHGCLTCAAWHCVHQGGHASQDTAGGTCTVMRLKHLMYSDSSLALCKGAHGVCV